MSVGTLSVSLKAILQNWTRGEEGTLGSDFSAGF